MTDPAPVGLPAEEPALAAVVADLVLVVDGAGVVRSVDGRHPAVGGPLAHARPGDPLAAVAVSAVAAAPVLSEVAQVLAEPSAASAFMAVDLAGPGTWTDVAVHPFGDGAVIVANDATAVQAELARLGRLADLLTGPFTGLGGRVAFTEQVDAVLTRAGAVRASVGVVVAHLDRFRPVGLAHGWRGRAEVLAVLADRLGALLGAGSSLTQPSDDTFALTVIDGDVAGLAEAVRAAVCRPVSLPAAAVVVTASVGYALGSIGDDPERLVNDAELAAVAAALDGGDRVFGASEDRRQLSLWRHQLEQTLRQALTEDGFRILYQPEIELATGRIIGAEALLRWEHEPWRDRSPAEVVALAEEVGLIGVLGEWVLRAACADAASWMLSPENSPYVAVNVSALQMADPRFSGVVAAALAASGLDPGRLCLELTETASFEDLDALRDRLVEIKRLGVSIALDDFGVGYAGLDRVSVLPVDMLKLDARFVAGMHRDQARFAVVEAAVALAQRLGIRVIAEGVEGLVEQDTLARLGYDAVQGYAVGAPMSSDELVRELARPARRRGTRER